MPTGGTKGLLKADGINGGEYCYTPLIMVLLRANGILSRR